MTRLILIRHGETEANVSQVWHGSHDAPLTDRGRIQVEATARRVQEIQAHTPVDAFYVSPLARAQSTAAAIAQEIGVQPTVAEGLREFDLGDWEGRSFQELAEVENLWEIWQRDPTFAPPNGESPFTFSQRAPHAVQQLVDAHPEQTVLAVSHGGIISSVLAQWIGKGPHEWEQYEPHNCAISILEWDGERWQASLLNDISHLPPGAVVEG